MEFVIRIKRKENEVWSEKKNHIEFRCGTQPPSHSKCIRLYNDRIEWMQSEWQTTHWNFHQQFEIICFSIVCVDLFGHKIGGICIEVTLRCQAPTNYILVFVGHTIKCWFVCVMRAPEPTTSKQLAGWLSEHIPRIYIQNHMQLRNLWSWWMRVYLNQQRHIVSHMCITILVYAIKEALGLFFRVVLLFCVILK